MSLIRKLTIDRLSGRLRRWLVDPHPSLMGPAHRREAYFLSSALLTLILLFGTHDIVRSIYTPPFHPPWYGYLFLLAGYGVSRTRKYRFAAGSTILTFPIVIIAMTATGTMPEPRAMLSFMLFSVLIASIFFSVWETLIVAAGVTTILFILPYANIPHLESFDAISVPFTFTVIGSLLILLLMAHRSATERERELDISAVSTRLRMAIRAGMVGTWDWNLESGDIVWSETAPGVFGVEADVLGRSFATFLSLVHPDDREFVRRSVDFVLEDQGELRPVEFRVVRPDGTLRWMSSIGHAFADDSGRMVRLVGMINDVSDRIQTQRSLERQVKELGALSNIGFVCTQTQTPDELIGRVTEIVGTTFYPDNFGILLVDDEGKLLRHHPSFRINAPGASIADIRVGEGVAGTTAQRGEVRRVNDTLRDPNYIALTANMRSEICVPIKTADRIIGVIDAESAKVNAFSDDDERLLVTIATELAVALQRLRAEHDLREKEALLARSQQVAHLGTWDWDLPTNVTSGSEEMAKIFGDAVGTNSGFSFDRIHPEDRPLVDAIMRTAMETRVIPQTEFRIIRTDGKVRTLVGQGEVQVDSRGIPQRVIGTALDITELRQAEDKFAMAFRSIQDAMAILRIPTGEFQEVNDGFVRMIGYTRAEAIGRTPRQLGMWKDSEDELRFRSELTDSRTVRNLEVHLLDKDRTEHACLVSSEIIQLDGEPFAVTMVRDISDRKLLEERLLQSQKLESIGRLAGGIAHDFNNYLSAILGYTDMAGKLAENNEKLSEYLKNIRSASDRAANLTRQLLGFARKQIIEPRIVSLNAVIEDADKMLRRLIGEDVNFVFRPGRNLPRVKIDPNQFDQVLVNLAVNARDAMVSGGTITITTSRVMLNDGDPRLRTDATGRHFVVMSIQDTGTGIPADVRKHIFEPFYTTKEQGRGTGLGLSTCLGIVEQNGGMIWVNSVKGKGTTFEVLLPEVKEFGTAVQEDKHTELPRGSETVLFVEDEHMLRDIGVETLRGLGYKVFSAANGPEALLFATTFKGIINILVTDVVMPKMSGRYLAEQVLKFRPATKVLYTSGYTESVISEHGILNPGISLLQKPYSPAILAARVRQILDGTAVEHAGS
ncbi:MAG: hypothetical protein A3G43_10105 [Ignavibacteria bacterium RIFCSPLOWO2_12_FULL_56_21]|nr:MAG: hypothetical protein A3G43_10105 [Ignavibacteria bacterium RIFCSPLOWO2_12_FULL_56_21]